MVFLNVFQLLKMFAVLPVITGTNERAFSTLHHLETSTMSETPLNGLGLLNIHHDILVHHREILSGFKKKPRRINLLI